jgi:hypothetical protein
VRRSMLVRSLRTYYDYGTQRWKAVRAAHLKAEPWCIVAAACA